MGVQVVESSLAIESFDLNSELLGITLVKPVSLSARGLMSYISYLRKNELNAGRYETELWSRISKTVTVVIMPVLALAFVFGSLRSTGSGNRLLVGVLIGLAYFLASEMIANSGQVFNLNPAIVTWAAVDRPAGGDCAGSKPCQIRKGSELFFVAQRYDEVP